MAFLRLGAFADSLSGKSGNTVFRKTKGGTVVSDHVIPDNPNTLAQQGVRNNFRRATTNFSTLSDAQVQAWNTFAGNFTHRTKGGKLRAKSGINVYAGLVSKMLQVNPSATMPTAPPSSAFTGDSITITAESETTGTVTFTASAANASGITTELLLQPLRNSHRHPQPQGYRTKAFFTFTSGTLTKNVTVPAGYYAAAYRFVKTSTGQETGLFLLPVQQVDFSVEAGNSGKQKKAA